MVKISNALRKHILKEFKELEQEILQYAREIKTSASHVMIPFSCDGVIDVANYDVEKDRITHIRATVGIGEGDFFLFVDNDSAYFDKTEIVEIPIEAK